MITQCETLGTRTRVAVGRCTEHCGLGWVKKNGLRVHVCPELTGTGVPCDSDYMCTKFGRNRFILLESPPPRKKLSNYNTRLILGSGSGTIRPMSLMPVVSRFGHWTIQVRAQRCVLCYDWSKCRTMTMLAVGIVPHNYD